MRACLAIALTVLLLVPSPALPQRKKPPRPPDIEILKMSSSRQEGTIRYDGALKVTADHPLNGLVLQLHFLDTQGVLLSIQKLAIEEGTVQPGDEKQISVQGNDVPRAVSFRIEVADRTGRDLSAKGGGPFPLD